MFLALPVGRPKLDRQTVTVLDVARRRAYVTVKM